MEAFSMLLTVCGGESTGTMMQNVDVFFDVGPHNPSKNTVESPVIWDAMKFMWRHSKLGDHQASGLLLIACLSNEIFVHFLL